MLEGNKNRLTNEEIEARIAHEEKMKIDTDKINPPKRLRKAQKEKFIEIANQLVEIEIFDNLSVDILAQYIEAYDNYVKVLKSSNRMSAKDIDADFDEYAKRMRTLNQLTDTCRRLASDLGLTITSRMKLVIPQPDKNNESPMAQFLKKRGKNG